jgi:hypothetical protein
MRLVSRWICWLTGIYRWISSGLGYFVSGCDWVATEVHEGVTVCVDRCEICGAQDVTWHRGPAHEWERPLTGKPAGTTAGGPRG